MSRNKNPQELNPDLLLEELKNKLIKIFGDKLKRIIKYGSYARGENHEGSDLDIMVY